MSSSSENRRGRGSGSRRGRDERGPWYAREKTSILQGDYQVITAASKDEILRDARERLTRLRENLHTTKTNQLHLHNRVANAKQELEALYNDLDHANSCFETEINRLEASLTQMEEQIAALDLSGDLRDVKRQSAKELSEKLHRLRNKEPPSEETDVRGLPLRPAPQAQTQRELPSSSFTNSPVPRQKAVPTGGDSASAITLTQPAIALPYLMEPPLQQFESPGGPRIMVAEEQQHTKVMGAPYLLKKEVRLPVFPRAKALIKYFAEREADAAKIGLEIETLIPLDEFATEDGKFTLYPGGECPRCGEDGGFEGQAHICYNPWAAVCDKCGMPGAPSVEECIMRCVHTREAFLKERRLQHARLQRRREAARQRLIPG